jgi:hypothetical protein
LNRVWLTDLVLASSSCQAHERQRESAEAEGARAEALQERLTQALLEIATVRQVTLATTLSV